jgi:hypothetical protein
MLPTLHVSTRVLRVTSLKDFVTEVPARKDPDSPRTPLRLINRRAEGQFSAGLLLSVQGLNASGEIVWLCEGRTIAWLYGQPFGPAAESAYAGMRELETIVRAYLVALGYDVRTGDYGLPHYLKPLGTSFECAKWVPLGESEWPVRAVTETVEATSL